MGRNRLSDNVLLGASFVATPMSGVSILSAWLDMRDADSALFAFAFRDCVGTPTFTFTVNAAVDDVGTDDEVVTSEAGYNPASDDIATVDVYAEDLPEGKPFVQVVLTETSIPNGDSALVEAAHLLENLRKRYGNRMAAAKRISTR